MPCGDSTSFPSAAFKTLGTALVSRQFSRSLLPPACDVACFVNTKIPGGDGPVPPVPAGRTFGAGLDGPSDAEIVEVGSLLLALHDQHEAAGGGDKLQSPLGAFPWTKIIGVVGTIIQGILLAVGESPIPRPDVRPQPDPVPPN